MRTELLREAASLMRARAENATAGPWTAYGHTVEGSGTVFFDKHALSNDAEHVASWDPAVALAVADWLEFTAITIEGIEATGQPATVPPGCYAVARAYLGASS